MDMRTKTISVSLFTCAENILVFDPPSGPFLQHEMFDQPGRLIYKISDLGCACMVRGLASAPETYVGTRGPYMAPEMMEVKRGPGDLSYTSAIDIWALGILMLQIRQVPGQRVAFTVLCLLRDVSRSVPVIQFVTVQGKEVYTRI